jgi:hypothetical protein
VVDEHDLVGAEQVLRHRQRAEPVVGHEAARVADHVSVALGQPEQPGRVHPRVHAGEHRHLPRGCCRELRLVEVARVGGVVGDEIFGGAQDRLRGKWVAAD